MADKNTQTGLVEFNLSDGKPKIGNWQTASQAQLSVIYHPQEQMLFPMTPQFILPDYFHLLF